MSKSKFLEAEMHVYEVYTYIYNLSFFLVMCVVKYGCFYVRSFFLRNAVIIKLGFDKYC